jgi:hypothetical protein
VLVVIIPWLTDTAAGYPHGLAHRIVELEARRAGFATIDLTEAFMQAGVEHLRIDPQDPMHPNQTGHTIIAHALSTYIRTHAKQAIRDKELTAVENAQ